MGSYIDRAYLQKVKGTDNITKFAKLGASDDATAIQNRIDEAILAAESEVEMRFEKSRYQVPIVTTTTASATKLKQMVADIATYILYAGRGAITESEFTTRYRSAYDDALADCVKIASGTLGFKATLRNYPTHAPSFG